MAFFMRVAVTKAATSGGGGQTHVDTEDLERAKRDLQQLADEMPHVAVRVLNKSMTGIKTDMKAIVRAEYNYKAATLDSRISIYKANRANIQGHIESKGGSVHLTDIAGTRQTAKGVTVDVRKSTGRQLIPRAFINVGRHSGKLLVYRRESLGGGQLVPRYPIKTRMTAHPEVVYNAPHNWAKIADASAKRINDNIAREIDAEFRRQEGIWG